jgi:hypothetical protein
MNNPDHISESSETIFWIEILKFFDADPGWKKFQIRNTGTKIRYLDKEVVTAWHILHDVSLDLLVL